MNRPCESLRPTAQPVPAKPPALSALWVEVASGEAALAFYADALEEEHALGAGHAAGRRLWQIVRRTSDDAPVAVLRWAASAFHLRARDAWIGWDAMTRSRRLGLIVNNSRLLILEEHRAPNLATQVLGAALRARCPRSGRRRTLTRPCWPRRLRIWRPITAPATRLPTGCRWP